MVKPPSLTFEPVQAQMPPVINNGLQHSPGSNDLKPLEETEGGNLENETKSISSLRSGGSLQERYLIRHLESIYNFYPFHAFYVFICKKINIRTQIFFH